MLTADEDAILEVARMVYDVTGSTGVRQLAELLQIQEYAVCIPCDTAVPVVADTCMVCWSNIIEKGK